MGALDRVVTLELGPERVDVGSDRARDRFEVAPVWHAPVEHDAVDRPPGARVLEVHVLWRGLDVLQLRRVDARLVHEHRAAVVLGPVDVTDVTDLFPLRLRHHATSRRSLDRKRTSSPSHSATFLRKSTLLAPSKKARLTSDASMPYLSRT